MNIKKIALDMIDVGDRLRTLNPVYAAEMAASFEDRGGEGKGQITPIEVRPPNAEGRHKLVSGLHRLEAARLSNWKAIEAKVFDGTNDQAEEREIDENLVRHDLSELDRAKFIARRAELWKIQHPDSVQGRAGAMARWHANRSLSFASNTAEKLGISEDTVQRWMKLAERTAKFEGDLRTRIAASDLADNRSELMALAAIEGEAEILQVLDLMASDDADRPRKVAAARLAIAGKTLPEHVTTEQAIFDAFTRKWSTYPKPVRERIANFVILDMKKTAGGSIKK